MGRVFSIQRCTRCEIRQDLCFCEHIPQIEISTRITILMHAAELKLTTNTARLAAKALPETKIFIRGLPKSSPVIVNALSARVPEDGSALVLFPSDDAAVLTPEWISSLKRPVTLFVPDGSWRQARRAVMREPAFSRLRRVKLPPGPPSQYRLREEPHAESVCTFEAIARALGVLEGPERGPHVQAQLEHLLKVMVERTLWARGTLATGDCLAAGIPLQARFGARGPSKRGALRHGF
jgi:DTW domain-containing protein YfiP